MTRPIILVYDGSKLTKEATRALRTAGEILRGHAVVAHVYAGPLLAAVAPTLVPGVGLEPGLTADPLLAQELEEHAREEAADRPGGPRARTSRWL